MIRANSHLRNRNFYDIGRVLHALAVVLGFEGAMEVGWAARRMAELLGPRVVVGIDTAALAEARVGAEGKRRAARIVLGVLRVRGALEARDAACGPLPAEAAALGILGGALRAGGVEHALAIEWVLVLTVERVWAALLVVVCLGPRAWWGVVIHPTALAIHWVEAQILWLALVVVVVHVAARASDKMGTNWSVSRNP